MDIPLSAYPSQRPWAKCIRGKGKSGQQEIYATCVTAPSARGNFRADLGASSGADMCPASDAAIHAAGPYGVRRSGPNQRRVLKGTLLHTGFPDPVSRPLRHTTPCPLSLRRPRGRRWLTPSRPETCRRRLEPSRPRRSAPSCWPALPAPTSAACATAGRPARCPAAPPCGRVV